MGDGTMENQTPGPVSVVRLYAKTPNLFDAAQRLVFERKTICFTA